MTEVKTIMKTSSFLGLNVKDFGAKGDGETDDTAAIQRALDAAAASNRTAKDTLEVPYVSGVPSIAGFHYHSTSREVLFPSGHYRVTSPLDPADVDTIRGEGHPWIEQANHEQDVFHSEKGLRQVFVGLILKGGKTHLNLGNANEDNGMLIIENCKFYGSGEAAIRMRKNSNSTTLLIQNCQCVDCEQILVTHTDFTHIRDCWFSCGRSTDGALIENRAHTLLTLDNVCGVPLVNGRDQRWIDNHGNLLCRNVRFGGESGGFAPVVNFAKYRPCAGGVRVLLDSCSVSAMGNNKRKCAVSCEEVPNLIEIRDCLLYGVPPVSVSETIDSATYFKAKAGMLKFNFDNNIGEFGDRIPDMLREPVVEVLEGVEAPSPKDAETLLEKAKTRWAATRRDANPASPGSSNGHQQKTNPAEYIDITMADHAWHVEDNMDGTNEKNSKYLTIALVDHDVLIMRKVNGDENVWPHFTIQDVLIDLAQYPWLSWGVKRTNPPGVLTVKLVDKATQRALIVGDSYFYESYSAADVRGAFQLKGKRTFDIKLYYKGITFSGKHRRAEDTIVFKAGDFMVLDFVRLERSQ